MTKEEALKLVNSRHWNHTFEIMPGIVTPGDWGFTNSEHLLDSVYGVPKNLAGLKALDIGALDGVHSFELERRGASVTAFDIQNPDVTGFNTAKKIIGSKVEYFQGTVYELSTMLKTHYDIILFFGVWYHLKNPIRAFEEVATVLKNTGTLYAEGEALMDYIEINGHPCTEDAKLFAKQMSDSKLPISIYYPNKYKGDMFNWYIPNKACVAAWLESSGMKMLSSSWWHDHPHQRLQIVAKKDATIMTTVDNPIW